MPCRQFLCCKVGPVCPVSRCVQACCCPEQRRLLPELALRSPRRLSGAARFPRNSAGISLPILGAPGRGAAPTPRAPRLASRGPRWLAGGDQPRAPLLRLHLRLGKSMGPGSFLKRAGSAFCLPHDEQGLERKVYPKHRRLLCGFQPRVRRKKSGHALESRKGRQRENGFQRRPKEAGILSEHRSCAAPTSFNAG